MIATHPNTLAGVLALLARNQDFTFHATGSRHFGTHKGVADFDFFTQFSGPVLQWLLQHPFTPIPTYGDYQEDGLDSETVRVLRWTGSGADQVDVILVRDVNVKLRAQDLITEFQLGTHLDIKATRRGVWEAMYRIARVVSP